MEQHYAHPDLEDRCSIAWLLERHNWTSPKAVVLVRTGEGVGLAFVKTARGWNRHGVMRLSIEHGAAWKTAIGGFLLVTAAIFDLATFPLWPFEIVAAAQNGDLKKNQAIP